MPDSGAHQTKMYHFRKVVPFSLDVKGTTDRKKEV